MTVSSQPPCVEIAVGLVEQAGRFLVARRPAGSHLPGLWEFPGGKALPDESLEETLRREIAEETAINFADAVLLHIQEHAYPERTVRLHFFLCRDAIGTGAGREGQETRWVTGAELFTLAMPEGNQRLLELLREQLGAEE